MWLQRLVSLCKLMQDPMFSMNVRMSQLHQYPVHISCKLHVYTARSPVPVRSYSAISRTVCFQCLSLRETTQVRNSKTCKERSKALKRSVRCIHDDTFDKGRGTENRDTNLEDKIAGEVAEEEECGDITENLFVDIDSKHIENNSPELFTGEIENCVTRSSSGILPSETDVEESVVIKKDDRAEALKHTQGNGSQSSESDIEKFMRDAEMVYDTGHTGYVTLCPKFGKLAMKRRSKKKEERLYINSTSGNENLLFFPV